MGRYSSDLKLSRKSRVVTVGIRARHRTMCQPSHCSPKGGGGTLGPKGGWIWGLSHIDWRKERVLARTLGPEGGWIVMSHIGWGGEQITIYKGVETFPSRRVVKALRGSSKGKAQRGQYLLAVDLGRYSLTCHILNILISITVIALHERI